MSDDSQSLAGKLIAGKYRLIRELSRGGMGQVYLAEHIDLEEPRAIKVIREELVKDESTRRRFLREIRATHRVSKTNEHVVFIFDDYGFQDGIGYYVMEFLDGKPLSKYIQENRGTLPIAWSLKVMMDIAFAMDEIHKADVIHRDLKPDNIIVIERPGKPELVKVVDFGIAKLQDMETRSTNMTQLVGTISYMSPEQIAVPLEHVSEGDTSLVIDHKSDIYSLGCILFEMFAGKTPFAPEPMAPPMAPHQLLWAHLHDPPPSIRKYRPDVPETLDAIILKTLEKEPDLRFATMGDFGRALGSLLDEVQSIDEHQERRESAVASPRRDDLYPPEPNTSEFTEEPILQDPQLDNATKTLDPKSITLAPPKPSYDPYIPTQMLHPWRINTRVESSPWEAHTVPDTSLADVLESGALSPALVGVTMPDTEAVPDEDATRPGKARSLELESESSLPEIPELPPLRESLSSPSVPLPAPSAVPMPKSAPPTQEFPGLEEPKAAAFEKVSSGNGRRRLLFWVVFLMFLSLGGWSAYWVINHSDTFSTAPPESHSSGSNPARLHPKPAPVRRGSCPKGMVYFATSRFLYGSATNDELRSFNEASLRSQLTPAFCIDTHEFPGKGQIPLTQVTLDKARWYCRRVGKRLCTEIEWERACKGEAIFRYPYGNRYEPAICNTRDKYNKNRKVTASGGFPLCVNSYGLYDMSGNVAEWTTSPYFKGSSRYTIRGGAANRPDWAVRCASRSSAGPKQTKPMLGFRCCATPQ
ncbi:MAG: hypothetical protein EP343_08690 [Deltaproteobacteria bacterium]|nr:MAG: hypothetical protein EP343_08690 [Deltaproteobacteria bacterium]